MAWRENVIRNVEKNGSGFYLREIDKLLQSPGNNSGWWTSQISLLEPHKPAFTKPTLPSLPHVRRFLVQAIAETYFTNPRSLWPVTAHMNQMFAQNQTIEPGPAFSRLANLHVTFSPLASSELKIVQSHLGFTLGQRLTSSAFADIFEVDAQSIAKVQRPLALFLFVCECDFFMNDVWQKLPDLAKKWLTDNERRQVVEHARSFLLFFLRQSARELDYAVERDNAQKGKIAYESANIHVVDILALETKPFFALLQERAQSQTLHEWLRTSEQDKQALLAHIRDSVLELLRAWIRNVFWGTGFFHAQLDATNVFIPAVSQMRKGNRRITVVDFGFAGEISSDKICKLLDLMLLPRDIVQFNDKWTLPLPNKEQSTVEPRGIAKFFGNFRGLAANQKLALNELGNPSMPDLDYLMQRPEIVEQHEHNLELVKAFIRQCALLCTVKLLSFDDVETLVGRMLDYSAHIDFAFLFQKFLSHARDFGLCMSNDITLFGIAATHIATLMSSVHDMPIDLTRLVYDQLKLHPQQFYRVSKHESVCQK
jgi:hypothetical protein